jgi:hypothetical protein
MRLDPNPARTTERCKLKGVTRAPACLKTFHSKRERHRGEPISFLVLPHVHANSEGTIK